VERAPDKGAPGWWRSWQHQPGGTQQRQVRISGRPISAVGSSLTMASSRRCPGLRSWRCRRSHRAARRADSARSRRRQFAKAHPTGDHRCDQAGGLAHHARRGVEIHWRPLIWRSCSVARSWVPGLPRAGRRVGHLVGADHDGAGVQLGHGLCLGQRQAQLRSRGLRRARGFIHFGRAVSNGSCRRLSSSRR
jgi:hypothetical protein